MSQSPSQVPSEAPSASPSQTCPMLAGSACSHDKKPVTTSPCVLEGGISVTLPLPLSSNGQLSCSAGTESTSDERAYYTMRTTHDATVILGICQKRNDMPSLKIYKKDCENKVCELKADSAFFACHGPNHSTGGTPEVFYVEPDEEYVIEIDYH
jgi:hypothetical protein